MKFSKSANIEWYTLILGALLDAQGEGSPQLLNGVKYPHIQKLIEMDLITLISEGKGRRAAIYRITKQGTEYHAAVIDGTLFDYDAWQTNIWLAFWYYQTGEQHEAVIPLVCLMRDLGYKSDFVRADNCYKTLLKGQNIDGRVLAQAYQRGGDLEWLTIEMLNERVSTTSITLTPFMLAAIERLQVWAMGSKLRSHKRATIGAISTLAGSSLLLLASLIEVDDEPGPENTPAD